MIEPDGLDEVGGRAELVGPRDVARLPGAGQDDDRDPVEFRPGADPGEDLEPRPAGELQVEQDEGRERVAAAVGVRALAGEVADRLVPVAEECDRGLDLGLSDGPTD